MKKMTVWQILTWGVILFVIPLPLVQAMAVDLPSLYTSTSLAIQIGSIAYVWMLLAVYLATKPKWLDRLIGLPSIYFIHGVLSMLAIALAYLHKEGTSSYGWIKTTGNWAFDLFWGLLVYSLVFMAGWLTSRFKPLLWLKKQLEILFKHELSVWIHRLNLIAVLLVFIHVQLISYITNMTIYIWLFNGYTIFVTGAYLLQKLRSRYGLAQGKLTAIQPIAANFYELTIQFKSHHALKLYPGDYVFINFPNIDHLKELHPFSILNSVVDGTITLAIRGDGDFSRAVQHAKVGSKVLIDGGYGRFNPIIKQHPDDELVLVTGGSGIVPMISLMRGLPNRRITLYYSAHSKAGLIYQQEIETLAAQRNNLTVHIQQGRFFRSVPRDLIRPNVTYLLSGPLALGQSWQKQLLNNGINEERVYYEEFSW